MMRLHVEQDEQELIESVVQQKWSANTLPQVTHILLEPIPKQEHQHQQIATSSSVLQVEGYEGWQLYVELQV